MDKHIGEILGGRTVLVTGGTGSFGRRFVQRVLKEGNPRKLIVFSRDEAKQHDMRQIFPDGGSSPVRYFIGDVRDVDRLRRAFEGVEYVVHAAAMKQVPACEYNPLEAVRTNVFGAQNVIEAAIDAGVSKVLALSTDKAVNPINLYGATKLCSEKLFIQGNAYSGKNRTRFACARYGNVVGSRGSVIPLFKAQRENGRITVTDERMTRFWITLEQGVNFVIRALSRMHGGEVFVPKIKSMKVTDLAKAIAPGCEIQNIGIRPGEKLHEVLVSEDEARRVVEVEEGYVILPEHPWWDDSDFPDGISVPGDFRYASDTNNDILTPAELQEFLDQDQ